MIAIGPAGSFHSPTATKDVGGYLVDKHLAGGLKLTAAQAEVIKDLRHGGKVERQHLSGGEKRTYTSLERKYLVVLVFQPYGHSYYRLARTER